MTHLPHLISCMKDEKLEVQLFKLFKYDLNFFFLSKI